MPVEDMVAVALMEFSFPMLFKASKHGMWVSRRCLCLLDHIFISSVGKPFPGFFFYLVPERASFLSVDPCLISSGSLMFLEY